MSNALWITLIGMGLVFIAILLLWGGMALLVRITTEREDGEPGRGEGEPEVQPEAGSSVLSETASTSVSAHKRRAAAAAAAVSVALALRKPALHENEALPGSTLSAWQAVNRASQVNQAANISRKKVAR
jgi:Na+-transporting methylmalonyl-CoA/oxaloacetate decarboxylase gamma subunit